MDGRHFCCFRRYTLWPEVVNGVVSDVTEEDVGPDIHIKFWLCYVKPFRGYSTSSLRLDWQNKQESIMVGRKRKVVSPKNPLTVVLDSPMSMQPQEVLTVKRCLSALSESVCTRYSWQYTLLTLYTESEEEKGNSKFSRATAADRNAGTLSPRWHDIRRNSGN